jgi:hypothetical protein
MRQVRWLGFVHRLGAGCGDRVMGAMHDVCMSSHDETREAATGTDGFSTADLPAMRREQLMSALEVARHEHDPATNWAAFREVVWREAALAFGFFEREPWPDDVPLPPWVGSDQSEGEDNA